MFSITELTGMAWHSAIENVIERMSRKDFRILTFRNHWQEAESHAIQRGYKFDKDGNII